VFFADAPPPGPPICFLPTPRCANGLLDGDETDVDCGGGCDKCGTGKICTTHRDCAANKCSAGRCLALPYICTNYGHNPPETDIDCGGPECAACAEGRACGTGEDCTDGICQMGRCKSDPPLTIELYGRGRVTSAELGLDCTSKCTLRIPDGLTAFSLSATPGPGLKTHFWQACGWSTVGGYESCDNTVNNPVEGAPFHRDWAAYGAPRPTRIQVGFFDPRVTTQWRRKWLTGAFIGGRAAADAAGNVLFAAGVSGSGTFGGVPSDGVPGRYDLLAGKVSPAGEVLWLRRFPNVYWVRSLAVDASGGILVTGSATREMTSLGGPPLTTCAAEVVNFTTSRTFLARYAADGSHLWSRCIPASPNGAAFDSQGHIVLGGSIAAGVADFGDGVSGNGGPPETYGGAFLLEMADADGRALRLQTFPSAYFSTMEKTADGRIVLMGTQAREVDLGGGPLRPARQGDIFLASMTLDLQHLWSRSYAVGGNQYTVMSVMADGGIVLTGLDSARGVGCPQALGGRFIARLDPRGHPLWVREVRVPSTIFWMKASQDRLVFTGNCSRGHCDFGGGPMLMQAPGQLNHDFLAILTPDGEHVWSANLELSEVANNASLVLDPDGSITIMGAGAMTRFRP
jgi:hypothetical protein